MIFSSEIPHSVYLHFEDWSLFTGHLDKQGIPHGGKIIKVRAGKEDPRDIFEKNTLEIYQFSGRSFGNETFNFGKGGIYTGDAIEQFMGEQNFTKMGRVLARALFRFATQPEGGFVQFAMTFEKDGFRFIDHPMKYFDGLQYAKQEGLEKRIHIDIFHPASLIILKRFVDYEDPSKIISLDEYMDYERRAIRIRMKEFRDLLNKEKE